MATPLLFSRLLDLVQSGLADPDTVCGNTEKKSASDLD